MTWTWPNVWADERRGWRRVVVTLFLFLVGTLLGNLLIFAATAAGLNEAIRHLPLHVQQMARPLAIITSSFLALAGCLIGVRFVHHKSLACVFTDGRPFRFVFALRSVRGP